MNQTNYSEKFSFPYIPAKREELMKFPEATLNSAFKTAALTMLALCAYERNAADAFEMLDFLKGPENVSEYEKQSA